MIRMLALLSFAVLLAAAPMPADTVKGVLLDNVCAADFSGDYSAAKELAKGCNLAEGGKKKGFAMVSEDGRMLKIDAKGNGLLMRALKYADKSEPFELEVEGKVKGDKVAVDQLRLS